MWHAFGLASSQAREGRGTFKACSVAGGENTLERSKPKRGSAHPRPHRRWVRARICRLPKPLKVRVPRDSNTRRGRRAERCSASGGGKPLKGQNPKSVIGV